MSLGTVSITSALLRGIAEGVEQVTNPRYITIIHHTHHHHYLPSSVLSDL